MAEKAAFIQRFWNTVVYNPDYKRGLSVVGSNWSDFKTFFGTSTSESGEEVSVSKVTAIDTVFSCINAISQDIAKLPFKVRKKTDKGRIIVNNQINYLIGVRPNGYTSSFNFWYNIIFNMLSFGNGYAAIKRGVGLEPEELLILDPTKVDCLVVEGEIWYRYETILIKQEDMLHFKLYSFDGIVGVCPITFLANTFGHRLKMNKYQAKVLGSKPEGIISFQESLNPEQYKQNIDMWKQMTQGDNLGSVAALSGGAKYQPFTLNPDVVQMLGTANLSDERITGVYRVPPTIIQKYQDSAFKGPEQQDTVYLKYTLTPILKLIEQECNEKLFKESNRTAEAPLYTNHNIKEMLRGSLKEQGEWYRLLLTLGLASFNEIREMEDMPPMDDGDMHVVQGAYIPLDQLREFYSGKSANTNSDSQRQLGFNIEALKQALEKTELMNNSE
jgi:HK97 family phage portal protein